MIELSSEKLFEKASRMQPPLRFESVKTAAGITIEDLWTLPQTSERGDSLVGIGSKLHREYKDLTEESFMSVPSKATTVIKLKLDIVKYIIETLQAENAEKTEAANKRKLREELDEAIADAEKRERLNKTPAELRALRDSL
jgi:hypothetical protein